MYTFLIVLSVIIGAGILFLLVGMMSPRNYQGKVTKTLDTSTDTVWKILNDIKGLPDRKLEIHKLEIIGNNEKGLPVWREYTDMKGFIEMEISEREPKHKIIARMIRSSFGMTGTWTYEWKSKQQQTELTITENSLTDNFVLRAIMLLTGRNARIKREFKALEHVIKPRAASAKKEGKK